ncbi:MAG TPA: acyl carrier protein [Gammaproteobacteria bacterium]|nr:acyl carrier protein [Gammaproteobacteria bacterium]
MPDYNEFLARIFEILKPFAKQGLILNEETELVTDLGLSSLQVMELIERIEDHFDMSIPLNILPDIRTVHDLAQQLEKLTRS